jgi:hypothetical protein
MQGKCYGSLQGYSQVITSLSYLQAREFCLASFPPFLNLTSVIAINSNGFLCHLFTLPEATCMPAGFDEGRSILSAYISIML